MVNNTIVRLSPEYQSILPEVMKEVYTQFVNGSIEREEKWLEMDTWESPRHRLTLQLHIQRKCQLIMQRFQELLLKL